MREGEEEITDEKEIVEIFNDFFIQKKIEGLKNNIDPTKIKDPLEKLKDKIKSKNLNFLLKTLSVEKVRKVMEGMKKKKAQD